VRAYGLRLLARPPLALEWQPATPQPRPGGPRDGSAHALRAAPARRDFALRGTARCSSQGTRGRGAIPLARPFVDLDLLVPDARHARSTLAAGFRPSGDSAVYPSHFHHLPPVHSPDHPIPVEVHSRLSSVLANLPFYPSRSFAPIGPRRGGTPSKTQGEDGLGLLRKLARCVRAAQIGGALVLQMFEWPQDRMVPELTALGYRRGVALRTEPFAICPAELS
jgi:hypothetical protein